MFEIDSPAALRELLALPGPLNGVVFQGMDVRDVEDALQARAVGRDVAFLGCSMSAGFREHMTDAGALVFPELPGLPFSPYRGALYTVEELYAGFDRHQPESYRDCLDARVYAHWQGTGRAEPDSILEVLARRLHDHAITDAIEELTADAKVVAIMGGHGMERSSRAYRDVATIARQLARRGFMLASGGGPGAMEATHLGPWLAEREDEALGAAIDILAKAPRYDDPGWLAAAFEVRERFPATENAPPSLGIPTWLYGHEPPNAFATHIGKYFANSVREDGLLMLAKAGVVYAPGSAGTIQEIFQDACQNHYVTPGVVSPMVFVGVDYWTKDKPVYPLLERLAEGREYAAWLSITDSVDEVVAALVRYDER